MKSFILGVAVTALLFVGAAFAFVNTTSAAPAAKATVVPLALSQLTLDRAFRVTVPMTYSNSGPASTWGTGFIMPPGVGVVITELRLDVGNAGDLTFFINGVGERFIRTNSSGAVDGNNATLRCDPPIIVRQGDIAAISLGNAYSMLSPSCVVAGYTVYPGET